MNPQIYLALTVFTMGISTIVMPWFRNLYCILGSYFVDQMGAAALNNGVNVWILRLWGVTSAPFMQAAHFFFGLGAFVAPLIAEPFLIATRKGNDTLTYEQELAELQIQVPYGIAGGLCLLIVIGFLVLFCIHPDDEPHPSESNNQRPTLTTTRKWAIVSCMAIFALSFAGVEVVFSRYLTTWAVEMKDLNLTKSVGAFMTSAFWISYTFLRLVSAVLISKWTTKQLILADIIMLLIGNALMLVCGSNYLGLIGISLAPDSTTNLAGIWIGVVLMGLGCSSVFPAIYAHLEQIMIVGSKESALVLIVFGLGEFIYPFLIGAYIETMPMILVYMTTFCAGLSGVAFLVLTLGLTPGPDKLSERGAPIERRDSENGLEGSDHTFIPSQSQSSTSHLIN